MKTRFLLLAVLSVMLLGSCEDEKISYSQSSIASGSTECSYHDVTAGAQIVATRSNNTTNVKAVVYVTSGIVNEVRVVGMNNDVDKVVELPYSETFITSDIRLNTEYEYVITWGEIPEESSIHIKYMVTFVDGKLSVNCQSFND